MIDFELLLQKRKMTLEKKLSLKSDRAVLQVQRQDGQRLVLRIYLQEIPAYQSIEGHICHNLPAVYETCKQDGLFVVEEEFIDGISLQEMLDGGACMDEDRTLSLLRKICSATAFLHARGFIHRDIKPEHVLMTSDNRIVLIDLDASMRLVAEKHRDTELLGTAAYAAPEQFGLSRSDVRTDIYAVGILMNELLTGFHPAVIRYRNGSLAQVIDRCTQMNPQDRFQTVEELQATLEDLLERKSVRDTPELIPAKGQKKKIKYFIAGVLCVGIMLGVVFLPGLLLNSGAEDEPKPNFTETMKQSGDSEEQAVFDVLEEENLHSDEDADKNTDGAGEIPVKESSSASSAISVGETVKTQQTAPQEQKNNPSEKTSEDASKEENSKTEAFDLSSLTETNRITLLWGVTEIYSGTGFGAPMFNSQIDVLYGGEKITEYEVYFDDASCGTAVKESSGKLHLTAKKEGRWSIYIVHDGKYAHFYWNTREETVDESETLTIHWGNHIIVPGACFGATMFYDTVTVCFDGQPVSGYTVELLDSGQGRAVINEDGTLQLIAEKKDVKPLIITYKGKQYSFRWSTD